MSNQDNLPSNTEIQPKSTQTKTAKERFVSILFVLILLASAVTGYFYLKKSDDDQTASKSYLTNQNRVVCATLQQRTLQCEDLTSGEVQRFDIPEAFHKVRDIIQSPDGTRLLIDSETEGIVVVDTSFKVVRRIIDETVLEQMYPSMAWADGTKKVLIRDVRREESDADFLPEPVVISMVDVETGESQRVFKTGEDADVEAIHAVGGNDEYVFITMGTTKNWVAESTAPPARTLNAVRLSDGLVRQVSTHQLDSLYAEREMGSFDEIQYDSATGNFIITALNFEGDASARVLVAKLIDNEFGLALEVVHDSKTEIDSYGLNKRPVLTSAGMVTFEKAAAYAWPDKLIDDRGHTTELKLAFDSESRLLSFPAMPELPTSASTNPEPTDYIDAPADTPAVVREFLTTLVTCEQVSDKAYVAIQLVNSVGTEQLSVSGGCEGYMTYYYILKQDSYELVLNSSEGLGCDERENAGLSPQLTDCRLPGEGL